MLKFSVNITVNSEAFALNSEIQRPHLHNQSCLSNTPVTSLQASITASRGLPSWE
jgi:hypothetical protein